MGPHPTSRALAVVVDDEATVREVVRAMLDRLGFEVLQAPDARAALALFEGRRGEVVLALLDLTMPGIDGIELLHQLRSREPELPVILMSGYSEREVGRAMSDPGPTAFLQKPFGVRELTAKIGDVLGPLG